MEIYSTQVTYIRHVLERLYIKHADIYLYSELIYWVNDKYISQLNSARQNKTST